MAIKRRVCIPERKHEYRGGPVVPGVICIRVLEFKPAWAHQARRKHYKCFYGGGKGGRPGPRAAAFIEKQGCEVMSGRKFDRLAEKAADFRARRAGFRVLRS